MRAMQASAGNGTISPQRERHFSEDYETGGHADTAHGYNYQLKMLMVIFYRAHLNCLKFSLTTENKAGAKFDDIVLELENNEGEGRTMFIQCKHKLDENKFITSNNLISSKSPFGLQTYFESYQKINKLETFASNSKKRLILFTNMNIDETLKADGKIVEVELDDELTVLLQFSEKTNNRLPKYYKLKNISDFLTSKENDAGNITEFEEIFLLAINQPNEKELDGIIHTEICEKFQSIDSKQSVVQLKQFIYDWMSRKEGKSLTKESGEEFFRSLKKTLLFGSIFENPEKRMDFGDFFESTEKLQKMLKETPHTLVHIKASAPSLITIKNIQALKAYKANFVALNLNMLLSLESVLQSAYNSRSEFTIVVQCSLLHAEDISVAKKALNALINSRENCEKSKNKIILISHEHNSQIVQLINGEMHEFIEGKCSYDDLTKDAQERILDYNIKFQGYDIKLQEIVGENCGELLREEILNKIIDKEEIGIGKPLPKLNETIDTCYIERDTNFNSKSKIGVIEGGPGIGKSTELTKMALKEKQENKNVYVIRLNFLDYVRELNSVLEDVFINMLIKSKGSEAEFEKSLLRDNLSKFPGHLSVFLDGLDEVSPSYDAMVIKWLKFLQKETKVRKIWVTTRPHAKNVLQKDSELDLTFHKLLPFDETHQKEFLQKYWNHSLKQPNGCKYIEIFVENLLGDIQASNLKDAAELIGIPLQTRMVAEIFEDKCASFLRSEGELKIDLQIENMNIYELFKQFIEKKFDVYFIEKVKLDMKNMHAKNIIAIELKLFHKEIQKLACKLMFSDKYDIFWKPNANQNEDELLEVGIVQKRNENVDFIHRTFAEYFLAERLYDTLHKTENNKVTLIEFLRFNYFQERNGMIRYFLDHFLANDSNVHMAVVKNDLRKVEELVNNDQSHLLAKDLMGRIPLHLSCIYSKFNRTEKGDLLYPVNNVIQFLISKDLEKDTPSQIVTKDIMNYTPYAYSVISVNFRIIRPFFDWNYSEHILDSELQFNNLKLQYDMLIIINNWFCFDDVLYDVAALFKKESIATDYVAKNKDNFRAIKPYFYYTKNSAEKAQMCKENNYFFLKSALRSYFVDVVCFRLTDEKYFNLIDDELRNSTFCQDVFSEAFETSDFLFLLGITLACPKTAAKLWMETDYIAFLKNTHRDNNEQQQQTKHVPVSNKRHFFSKNNFKNYLVLALRQLLIHNRINSPVATIEFISYFAELLTEDFLSFDVSLKLMNEAEKNKIHEKISNTMIAEKYFTTIEINSKKVLNVFKYIKHNDFYKWMDTDAAINVNKEAAIRYFRDCFSKKDIIATNYLLMYALHYFEPSRRWQELESIIRDIHMSRQHWVYFIKPDALSEKIQNQIYQSLDQYLSAASRGYPLSVTKHIISQIVWLNAAAVPPFVDIYFKDQNKHNFADEVLKEVKKGNIKDLLRYFTFISAEDRSALLRENNFELVKYCLRSKNEGILLKGKNAFNAFMSDEYANNVIKYEEYGVCLLTAFEMQDFAQLYFLNLFFKSECEMKFEESVDFKLVFVNALNQMDHKWLKKLLNLLKSTQLDKVYRKEGLELYLPRVFHEDIKVFNHIITELEERDKYLNETMYVEAFKNAVVNQDYERLDGLHYIDLYKKDWVKNMKEKVQIGDYINYFKDLCKKEHFEGLKAIMKYKSDEDQRSIDFFLNYKGVSSHYNDIVNQSLGSIQWQELANLLEQYDFGITKGLHCPIIQFVQYCLTCIKEPVDMPNCVKSYFQANCGENSINYLEEVFEENEKGNSNQVFMWYHSVPGEQKMEIIKDAFRKNYIAHILDSVQLSEDVLNEITKLSDYNNCVSGAIKDSDFKKLKQLTKILNNEKRVKLWEKMDYKTAFINALAAKEHQWVQDFLKLLKSKHEELLQLNDFTNYISDMSNSNFPIFQQLINKMGKTLKDRILKEIHCTNAIQNALKEKDERRLSDIFKLYENHQTCLDNFKRNVDFKRCFEYCKHFIERAQLSAILACVLGEEKERLKSLLRFYCNPESHESASNSNKLQLEIDRSESKQLIDFAERYPSAVARGYPWSVFHFVSCIAACLSKFKPIPKCVGIYLEKSGKETGIGYVRELLLTMDTANATDVLLWFLMATDTQQREIIQANNYAILKDSFKSGYFEQILYDTRKRARAFLTEEIKTDVLAMEEYNLRLSNASEKQEFRNVLKLTKFLNSKNQLEFWQQLDYKTIYKDAMVEMDHEIAHDLHQLFWHEKQEDLSVYYDAMKYS